MWCRYTTIWIFTSSMELSIKKKVGVCQGVCLVPTFDGRACAPVGSGEEDGMLAQRRTYEMRFLLLEKWVRVWVNLFRRQRMVLVPQRIWKLMQSLKPCNPAVVLAKGHRQHARHNNLNAVQSAGKVFWRCLID